MRTSHIRFFVLLLTIVNCQLSISLKAQTPSVTPTYNLVQGRLMFNVRYCGGARPTEEMLAQFDSLRPLPNTTVFLSRTQGGKFIYKLVSDSTAHFKKKMKAGKYFVYMSKDYNHDVLSNFNPGCAKWMKTQFAEVEVINGGKKLYNIALHFGCDPCSPPRP